MNGTCPYCNAAILQVNLSEVNIVAVGNTWRGVTYACGVCNRVLTVVTDPISVKGDTVDKVVAAQRPQ